MAGFYDEHAEFFTCKEHRPSTNLTANGCCAVEEQLESDDVCWICLDASQPLRRNCACPRLAHPACLARWQLQSAGSRKETHCEFCDKELPDWKKTLTPQCGANAPAVMNVNFDGRTYSFEVKPGPDGYRQFTEAIRRAFNLPEDSELNITFTCDEPSTGAAASSTGVMPSTPAPVMPQPEAHVPTPQANSLLTLQGAGAYDAAVHCASVSAARRMIQHGTPDQSANNSPQRSPSTRGHSLSPAASDASTISTSSSDSDGASSSISTESTNSLQNCKNRRLVGLGRKLRSAISDFLTMK